MSPRMFELAEAYRNLENLVEEGEDFDAALADMAGEIKDKAENYAKVIKNIQAHAAACKATADTLLTKVMHANNAVDRIQAHLLACLDAASLPSVEGDVYTVAVQASPPHGEVWAEDDVPEEYRVYAIANLRSDEVPEELKPAATWRANMREIIAKWKENGQEIPGVTVAWGRHVRIR